MALALSARFSLIDGLVGAIITLHILAFIFFLFLGLVCIDIVDIVCLWAFLEGGEALVCALDDERVVGMGDDTSGCMSCLCDRITEL